jgi:hypothetical protein
MSQNELIYPRRTKTLFAPKELTYIAQINSKKDDLSLSSSASPPPFTPRANLSPQVRPKDCGGCRSADLGVSGLRKSRICQDHDQHQTYAAIFEKSFCMKKNYILPLF